MAIQPFAPAYGTNQPVSSTSPAASISIVPGNKQLRVVNTGTAKGYVKAFNSKNSPASTAASAADFCVPGGMASTITINQDFDTVSHFSSTGTTLEIMEGEGF